MASTASRTLSYVQAPTKATMNTRYLTRAVSRLEPPRCLHRPFSTSSPTSSDPPPQRPQPPLLPSNIARNTSRTANRDANIAYATSMMQDIDRTRYNTVREYDAQRAALNDGAKMNRAADLERQMPRTSKWKVGDVYAPHDLSAVEATKWRKRKSSERDVFDVLGINPLEEYKNFSMMSEYMTNMGRIKHRRETGLRAVNQRKIAKAIRRAVGMGLLPSVHEHPEVLEVKARDRRMRLSENRYGARP